MYVKFHPIEYIYNLFSTTSPLH